MGKISTNIADLSIFTAEDPRSENIFDILRRMRSKAIQKKYLCIPERGEAIYYALKIARKGDIVGIFGKGHEKSMCFEIFEHPWSDQEYINNLLKENHEVGGIILAAGKGTRMKSRSPKALRTITGRPILAYTLENLRKSGVNNISVVVSFRKNEIMRRFPLSVTYKYQKNPKGGTADALKAGLSGQSACKTILVLNGDDSAFYRPATISKIIDLHTKLKSTITFVSLVRDNPFGLGRVVRDKNGNFIKIVEEKDASFEEKQINEVNDGLYLFDEKWLKSNILDLKKSKISGELYITELLKLAVNQKKNIQIFKLPDSDEWQGINTPEQLMEAEDKMIARLSKN